MTQRFSRILVATDFSPASDCALDHGRMLAAAFGATLHVLHVVENVFLRAIVANPHDIESARWRQLGTRVSVAAQTGLDVVPAVERSDAPAAEIVDYARKHHMDLIIMGTCGRQGLPHLLMGNVVEHVMRVAPCPVLTVPTSLRIRKKVPAVRMTATQYGCIPAAV